jgi:polyhydroxyalkanoate synthesis regulator phasin
MKTPPTNMTHEELERWHYADGDTALATMHAVAADGEAAIDEAEQCESSEIQRLKDELDTAGSELDDANEEIDRLTDRVAELEDELAELKNLA